MIEAERSEIGAVLVGMAGFVVLGAEETDGELWLSVETTRSPIGCSACGTKAKSKDRRTTLVRDLPMAGRPTVLAWRKRRWSCPEPDCSQKTWSELSEAIRPRATLTERARAECCRLVGEEGRSVAEVARSFGVGWDTVMAAEEDYGRPLVDHPDRIETVRCLGIDETSWLSATPPIPPCGPPAWSTPRRAAWSMSSRDGTRRSCARSWASEDRPGWPGWQWCRPIPSRSTARACHPI